MRSIKYVLALSAAALLLAGCGGAQSDQSTSSVERHEQPQAGAPGLDAKQAPGSATTGGAASGGRPTTTTPLNRSVVYTATLRVQAKNLDEAATKAKQLVTAAGGYVEHETASSQPQVGNVTFKVPSDKYAGVLEQLTGQLGTKLSLQQEAADVTEQVADVNSRVKSAQATLQTFRKLLDRTQSLGEILNVEQEITQRESDLESLQARQKSLAEQTRYATVTLQLETPGKPAPKPTDGGFTGALKSGWNAFLTVLSVIAVLLGWSLPFLVVAAVIGLPLWKLRKARRERATPATPPMRPTPPMPPYPTNPQ